MDAGIENNEELRSPEIIYPPKGLIFDSESDLSKAIIHRVEDSRVWHNRRQAIENQKVKIARMRDSDSRGEDVLGQIQDKASNAYHIAGEERTLKDLEWELRKFDHSAWSGVMVIELCEV